MKNFIIIGIVLSIIVIGVLIMIRKEYYHSGDTPPSESPSDTPPNDTPWIQSKTPVPTITETPHFQKVIATSVDPGAHIECENWCKQKSGEGKSKQFMQVCIDTCIQEKWRNPTSKLTEFKT